MKKKEKGLFHHSSDRRVSMLAARRPSIGQVTASLMAARRYTNHRPINQIDAKAKCRHRKKLTCKGTLRQVFIEVYRLDWRDSQS